MVPDRSMVAVRSEMLVANRKCLSCCIASLAVGVAQSHDKNYKVGRVVDDTTQQGMSFLLHCQCSRSPKEAGLKVDIPGT